MSEKLRSAWQSMSENEKRDVAYSISKLCNVAIWTVQCWAKGHRNPKPANREIVEKYMSEYKCKH